MRKSPYVALICAALFLIFTASQQTLLAQSDAGSISGFVRDASQAVVPNAKVVITNEGTGAEHPVVSDSAGHYTVTNLPPGEYSLTAEVTGFKKFASTHNKLNANSTLSLDANLVVGATTETVEVSATASQLQTESGAVQRILIRSSSRHKSSMDAIPFSWPRLRPEFRAAPVWEISTSP